MIDSWSCILVEVLRGARDSRGVTKEPNGNPHPSVTHTFRFVLHPHSNDVDVHFWAAVGSESWQVLGVVVDVAPGFKEEPRSEAKN